GDAELPGGEYPGVARNQPAVLAHQRRRRPAPLLDARGYRGDLGIRVGPCIFGIWDQPVDRPPLDLVGWPRPLVLSRVHWVRPELVAEVKFLTWTGDNLLRQVVTRAFHPHPSTRPIQVHELPCRQRATGPS